jgi:transposase InsO family protein
MRKHFPRNPYTVNNINDVWESELIDVHCLAKYNGVKYILSVTDVFFKFLNIVPHKTKTAKAITSAFQSILNDPKYLKPIRKPPIRVQTDNGKEFLNKTFQDMLKYEGIEFQICRNPDAKCTAVESAHRTIRYNLYR